MESVVPGVQTVEQRISCDLVSYGPTQCERHGVEGKVLNVPANMEPEGNKDHHFSYDDETAGGEYDFWHSDQLGAPGSTLHVGTGGFCKWGTDGTNCSDANATQIATSIGGLDPVLIKRAEESPSGTLGYALSSTTLCADETWVYPAAHSDGFDTDSTPACFGHTYPLGRPPEGTRWFLNKTDAEIDALDVPPSVKAILRTMDREHYGGIIVDSNWSGAPGLALNFHRGDYNFMATEAGLSTDREMIQIPIGLGYFNPANDVVFCSNGTC
jgi:hypothetical protein